ncbi:hypothetical protein CDLVIII_3629 [Clostridium sp. DL-VIII]|uniref:TolC family protein n=1 Tax=Clostridium sp. DL-VIII TaxID=641107 RepID=UPI00023AFCF4|nr:TolC family protein [Clostridium sp. DL-VIII]EHJ00187.1 hypothetical protein CDLVIII_3629 [Clostridium sp. DL-VIII]
MKKKLIGFLIMTLISSSNVTLLNTSYAHAATTDNKTNASITKVTDNTDGKIKVKLDNIRDIMIENSLDLKKYDNNLAIAKENYDYYSDEYGSISDLKEKVSDAKAGIDNFAPEYDENGKQTNASDLTNLQKEYNDAKSNLNSLISAQNDYRKAKKDYNANVEGAVYTAKSDYLNYLVTLSNKELQEDQVKADERDNDIAKVSYDSGFTAKKDYVASTLNNTASSNKLSDYTNAEALAKTKLCNELGVNEEDVIFEVDVTEDFQNIANINYEKDLQSMLDNNIDIQEAQDTINETEYKNDISDDYDLNDEEDDDASDHNDTIYDYNMDNYNINLTQTKNTAQTNFKGQYDTLMNAYNTIKNTYDKLNEEQTEYETKQVQNDYGFLAKNDLDNAKLTFDTDKAAFVKDRNACYLAYLKYIQMKEGY